MNHSTPLSRLAYLLKIRRDNINTEDLTIATCEAAFKRIEELNKKLSSTIQSATSMAQELQEILGEAQKEGNENPLPATQELVNEWEQTFKTENLIDEATA